MKNKFNHEIIQHAIDGLENLQEGVYACDLHHELYNTDYFIIGRYEAEQFLIRAEGSVFNAIYYVQETEESEFGEIYTDFSEAERLCNSYTYWKGTEVLNQCKTVQRRWDEKLTEQDYKQIIEELNEL